MGVVFDEMGVIAYKITDVSHLHKLRKNTRCDWINDAGRPVRPTRYQPGATPWESLMCDSRPGRAKALPKHHSFALSFIRTPQKKILQFVTVQRIISRSALTGRNLTNQFKSYKSLYFFTIEICLICKDLKDLTSSTVGSRRRRPKKMNSYSNWLSLWPPTSGSLIRDKKGKSMKFL